MPGHLLPEKNMPQVRKQKHAALRRKKKQWIQVNWIIDTTNVMICSEPLKSISSPQNERHSHNYELGKIDLLDPSNHI